MAFRSKDNLIALYLHRRDNAYRRWLTDWAAAHPHEPPLLAVFDALGGWTSEHGPRGCAFVNASGELADPDHPVHHITRDHTTWVRAHLHDLATAAGHPDPGDLVGQLLALHEGAAVLYSTGTDPDAAATARRAAATLLAHRPGPGAVTA